MKRIIPTIVSFIFSILLCSAQSKNEINDLLVKSIEQYISAKEELIKEGALNQKYLNRIIFLSDNFSEGFTFSAVISERYNISFFEDAKHSKSDLKNGVKAFKLLPVTLVEDTLKITIADVVISKKGRNTTIGVSDYSVYKYGYSCRKRQWKLLERKDGGI